MRGSPAARPRSRWPRGSAIARARIGARCGRSSIRPRDRAEAGHRRLQARRRRVRRPRRWHDLKAELERALAEAASSPGRAWAMRSCSSIGCSPTSRTRWRRCKLVQSLAQPYPNHRRGAASPSRSPRTTRGSPTFDVGDSRCRRSIARWRSRPGWEQAIAAQGRDPRQAVAGPRRRLSGRVPESAPRLQGRGSALVQVRIQQKRYARSARDPRRSFWEKDQGNHEYEFGIAMLAIQTKDWARRGTTARGTEARRTTATTASSSLYLAQIAEETGRYELALERFSAVPDGERGWFAKLRAAAMLGKLGRARRGARAISPTCRRSRIEQQVQVQQAQAQLLRDAGDNAGAYEMLDAGARRVSRRARPSLRPRDGRREARPDRRRRGEAHAARRAQADERARAERARLHARRPHDARRRGTRADRARARARARTIRSSSTASAGRNSGWASSTKRRNTCGSAMEQRPDPEIAAHLGEVLWAKGERALRAGRLAVAAEDRARQRRAARNRAPAYAREPLGLRAAAARHALLRRRRSRSWSRRARARRCAPSQPPSPRVDAPFAIDGRLSARRGNDAVCGQLSSGRTRRRATSSSCRRRSASRSPRLSGDASTAPRRGAHRRRPRRGGERLGGADRARRRRRRCRSRAWRSGRRARRVRMRRIRPKSDAPGALRVLRQDGCEIVYAYADDAARSPVAAARRVPRPRAAHRRSIAGATRDVERGRWRHRHAQPDRSRAGQAQPVPARDGPPRRRLSPARDVVRRARLRATRSR